MIKREIYLNKIKPFYDKDLIKVITGIRRCGKSVLMKQIIEELKNTIKEENIIYMNIEDEQYSSIIDDKSLNDFILSKIKNEEKYYILIDEVQNVKNFERAVNSLKATKNVSIFVTGSNSNLLSSELATLLTGRYVSFKIMPFSFEEVCVIKNINIKDTSVLENEFNKYLQFGGMPQIYSLDDEESINIYLIDVFDSIVTKDIIKRYNVKNLDLIERVIKYIITNPSQVFSALNMTNELKKNETRIISQNVSIETMYNYIKYAENANIINKLERYDLRGKRILTGKYKYYVTDLGFTNINSVEKKTQIGFMIENIVFNELIKRGFNVNYGYDKDTEIDFIATKMNERVYIQVAYLLANDDIVNREFSAFNKIDDNYKKIVLSLDKIDFSQNGIIHKNLIDFLLDKEII